ncbi:MAG: efflux RND transporter permease subunit [Bdellovibrionales bacterium]|nr:efflux RND transporter permease subunit [Bdellovibrionales bacterium]
MRNLISFFIRQSLFGDLLTAAVILVGVASLFLIRREIFPNVEFDFVSVTTVFPGASPEEVEKLLTNPIEQSLKEVDGIKKVFSSSTEGLSSVNVQLDPDVTTGAKGKSNIQDVVERIQNLPKEADKSIVTNLESKQGPILEVSVAGDVSPMELRSVAKRLEEEIESISGVARVVQPALRDKEVRVEPYLKKLAINRLSLDDLVLSLKNQNVAIPGGTIEASGGSRGREKIVRTKGDFSVLDDVKNTVVRANDMAQSVTIGKVADVFYDLERPTILTRANGQPALSLTVLQKEKSDAIDMVDAVRKRVDELKATLNPKLKITYINDFSEFIRRRLSILTSNLGIGLLLVLLLLPLMIPFRFSLIIALGEPFAFLGTILILYWTDHSINLISMVGLIIVSGILVDDSIVVTENAVRLVDEGMDPKEAAIEGTRQIVAPVTASVLTTTLAFLPMAFMSGIFGKFVREIPIAVITALAVSLFETFVILPAHVAQWIKPKSVQLAEAAAAAAAEKEGKKKKSLLDRLRFLKWLTVRLTELTTFTQKYWDQKMVPVYIRWLEVSLKRRYWVAAGMAAFFFLSIGVATQAMKLVLFPPEGVEIFFVQTKAPVGTSLEAHEKMLRPIEEVVEKLDRTELQDFTTQTGLVQQDPNDPETKRGSEFAQISVFLTPETQRKRTAAEIIEDLRVKVGKPEGLSQVNFVRVNTGPPTGKPVSLGVRGRTYEELIPVVEDLKKLLGTYKGVTDISDSFQKGKEEVRIHVNAAEAAAAGLSVASIGMTVRSAFEGIVATSIRELDEQVDVRVSLPKAERTQESSLTGLLIPNPTGNLIPLSAVSRVKPAQGLASYEHEDNKRQVKVTAEVDTKVTSAIEVNKKIRDQLPEFKKKHPGVIVAFGGEDEDTQESLASLGRAFGLAILGIFLLLVLTFKSLLQPLVILITVPLGIVAVIWAFFIHGLPFSFMGMLGIVALAGVIVNNAIVLVDFVNQRRAEGIGKRQSILEAAETRVRPIFLTTVTTVIGILPTAYGIGGLDMFVVPIAMALGWGIMFGSILTAFVFPAALSILDDVSDFFKGRKGAKIS